jgi:hypothetical protein
VYNSDFLLCVKLDDFRVFCGQITKMLYHAPHSLENYICDFFKKIPKSVTSQKYLTWRVTDEQL